MQKEQLWHWNECVFLVTASGNISDYSKVQCPSQFREFSHPGTSIYFENGKDESNVEVGQGSYFGKPKASRKITFFTFCPAKWGCYNPLPSDTEWKSRKPRSYGRARVQEQLRLACCCILVTSNCKLTNLNDFGYSGKIGSDHWSGRLLDDWQPIFWI